MAGDHLTNRQLNAGYTVLGQHSLTNATTGLYSTSTADWPSQATASKITLPRCGKVGSYLINQVNGKTLRCVDNNTAMSPVVSGVTLECVAYTTLAGYSFFGGPLERSICSAWGWYGFNITIALYPVNDAYTDTSGRARITVSDVGGTRVASRTVHSRPVISNGLPHHLALTHANTVTTDAIKLYVDGVKTETVTVTAALADIAENTLSAGVDDYLTGFDGSVSHLCLTQAVLPEAEIKARSLMVNGTSGKVLTDQGKVMAWSEADSAWIPVKAWGSGFRIESKWRYPQ